MIITDYCINILLSIILIVGCYQFYFWCQRRAWVKKRHYHSLIDEAIPFQAWWVWIYSFLYYPAIIYLNLLVSDSREFTYMAASFILLLLVQMVFFLLLPVETPAHWREYDGKQGLSVRFLRFVQKYDKSSNCFPSMHTSVAMLTALYAMPYIGLWSLLFPILIALSCIFTKQHYLIDLPTGAALGWGVFYIAN